MLPARLAACHERLRAASPLVHNITNYVAMDVSANALLALGASPAMVHAVEEVEAFASLASSIVLNIGTLSPRWVEAMHVARRVGIDRGVPVVLDPVGAGATPFRTEVARRLLSEGVTAVRGNASEILALLGDEQPRGVDSAHTTDAAQAAAEHLARTHACIVAVTGQTDLVTDGQHTRWVSGGDALMTRVTAMGCALSAAVAAYLASSDDHLDGATAALATWAVCGEQAAHGAEGPGSFRSRFLDALSNLPPLALAELAQVAP